MKVLDMVRQNKSHITTTPLRQPTSQPTDMYVSLLGPLDWLPMLRIGL